MDFFITSDTDSETGISTRENREKLNSISLFFKNNDYGESVQKIYVCLVCVNPLYHKFKQRKRYLKKDKLITHDIMLDFNKVIRMESDEKMNLITHELSKFIDDWKNYKFEDFDRELLKRDIVKAIALGKKISQQ